MTKIFNLSADNAQEVKQFLIEKLGMPSEVVNNLEPGYYKVSGENEIVEISEIEFFVEKHKGAIVVGSVGSVTAGVSTAVVNSELNTEYYNTTNDAGKNVGWGYSFEDIANRKARKEGKTVNSYIGKNWEKGGADAIINGRKIQYKCSIDARRTADKIEARSGYPDQDIVVNSELYEPLKVILKKREEEGRLPKGTANRVIDSGISIDYAKKVSTPMTKESLLFDAGSALPTLGVVFVAATGASLLYDGIDSGELKMKKALTRGSICGGLAFAAHIVWNQIRRM